MLAVGNSLKVTNLQLTPGQVVPHTVQGPTVGRQPRP